MTVAVVTVLLTIAVLTVVLLANAAVTAAVVTVAIVTVVLLADALLTIGSCPVRRWLSDNCPNENCSIVCGPIDCPLLQNRSA